MKICLIFLMLLSVAFLVLSAALFQGTAQDYFNVFIWAFNTGLFAFSVYKSC